ncbi:hypothetical protein [Planktotalea sp.]|uniref:hypothetical protein n=1 Tax=Planktotalea sp. TaxID=2029877 RepID=UPI003F6D00FB
MKHTFLSFALICFATGAHAQTCEDHFAKLLINGNQDFGPTQMHITQEIVGVRTSITQHNDTGNGNGMSKAIDPESDPWTLFANDKMYMSHDKGATWGFVTDFDGEKGRADHKQAMTRDAKTARDVSCAKETSNDTLKDVVAGTYDSSVIEGAEIYEKFWVNPETGFIAQSYRYVKSTGFETKTTQVVTLNPDFVLPKPE